MNINPRVDSRPAEDGFTIQGISKEIVQVTLTGPLARGFRELSVLLFPGVQGPYAASALPLAVNIQHDQAGCLARGNRIEQQGGRAGIGQLQGTQLTVAAQVFVQIGQQGITLRFVE